MSMNRICDNERRVSIEFDAMAGKVEFRAPAPSSSPSSSSTTTATATTTPVVQQQTKKDSTANTATTTTPTGDIFEQIQSLSLREKKRCKTSSPSFQLAISNERRTITTRKSMKRRRSPSSRGSLSENSSLTGEKLLCFDQDVCIYEFKTILGDQLVSDGCPVALDSQLLNSKIVCLEQLERFNDRRRYNQLKMKSNERAQR